MTEYVSSLRHQLLAEAFSLTGGIERRLEILDNAKTIHDLMALPTLTDSNLANELGIGRGPVKEYLRRLKAKGVLVREGSTRTGRWRLTGTGRAAIDCDE